MRHRNRKLVAVLLLAAFLIACKPIEEVAGEQIAGAKAVLDAVQADYEAKRIPQTETTYRVIATAVSVQNLTIDALQIYVVAKGAYEAAPTDPEAKRKIEAAEAALRQALKNLSSVVKQVQSIKEAF